MPMHARIMKSNAFSVKLIYISAALLIASLHVSIPIPDKIYSLTLPTPGSLRTSSFSMKSSTTLISF